MWDSASLESARMHGDTSTFRLADICAFWFLFCPFHAQQSITALFFSSTLQAQPAKQQPCTVNKLRAFLPACHLNAPTGFTDSQHFFNYVFLGVWIKPEAVHKSLYTVCAVGSRVLNFRPKQMTLSWQGRSPQEAPVLEHLSWPRGGFNMMINTLSTLYDLFALFINNWAKGKISFLLLVLWLGSKDGFISPDNLWHGSGKTVRMSLWIKRLTYKYEW